MLAEDDVATDEGGDERMRQTPFAFGDQQQRRQRLVDEDEGRQIPRVHEGGSEDPVKLLPQRPRTEEERHN